MDERLLRNQLINNYVMQQYQSHPSMMQHQRQPQQASPQPQPPTQQHVQYTRQQPPPSNRGGGRSTSDYMQEHQQMQQQFEAQQKQFQQQYRQYTAPPTAPVRTDYQRTVRSPSSVASMPTSQQQPPPRRAPPTHTLPQQPPPPPPPPQQRRGMLKSVELPDEQVLDDFKNQVRLWIEIDNSITKLRAAMRERNVVKKQLTENILKFMARYNIEDLNTKDGSRLRYKVTQVKQTLTAKMIKDRLTENLDKIQTPDDLDSCVFNQPKIEKISLKRLRKKTVDM